MILEDKHIQQGYVKAEIHNQIATIEFFHPQSNSLPAKILAELAHEITYSGNDSDVRVIVLRSAGEKTFCAGASFDELMVIKNEQEGLQFFSGFANVINAMRKCPKFILARVHGKCVGGGVGLVAAADYTIAIEGADIKLSELAVGIGPFVVGPAIERKMEVSAYSQLAIDAGIWRNADWARQKGLYAEVHSSAEEMDESVLRLSNSLASSNPEAMAEMKKVFWHGTENWDHLLHERAVISGRLVLSNHTKEFIEKFKQKQQA
ncbi:MAG: enoyl-CoA hydratase/isomerase family protein [Parafilimonas sp.]